MFVSTFRSGFWNFSRRFLSQNSILPYEIDRFNGVKVQVDGWPENSKTIREILSNSIQQWKTDQRTSAWLWIPIEKAHIIPIAAELGFTYHNAEERMAVLNQWLLPAKSQVPRFATHQVGVGGAVLRNQTNELLVIKERVRNIEFWKLPGGAAELSENIADCAIREVFEETGVRSKFESIIGFRQSHNYPGGHGRSDLYFMCRLSALTDTIDMDRNEVLDCRWVSLEEAAQLKNPLLQHVAKLLTYGLQNNVEKSIDFKFEQIPSIVTGYKFDIFTHSLKSNE